MFKHHFHQSHHFIIAIFISGNNNGIRLMGDVLTKNGTKSAI
jgi:hypothetical protein